MSETILSVIVPTKGRATLAATIASIPEHEGIEALVVGDGPQPLAKQLVKNLKRRNVRYIETLEATHDFGNSQRDFGISVAKGRRLLFMDDDDAFTPDAFEHIWWWNGTYPDDAIVFRMRYSEHHPEAGKVLWHTPQIRPANVGSPMFSPLNDPARLAKWADGDGYLSDFQFIAATSQLQTVTFSPEVVCEIWPTGSRLNEDSQQAPAANDEGPAATADSTEAAPTAITTKEKNPA